MRNQALLLIFLAVVVAGCGGSKSSPAGPSPDSPVIANLAGTFSSQSCSTGAGTGTLRLLSFDYTDSDGNVQGGAVQVTVTLSPGGLPGTGTFGVPSPGVSVSGTTSGTITIEACVRFGGSSQLSENVTLLDAVRNPSNTLSVGTAKPPGLP